MKALIIYDSAFGNTAQIAEAIGNAVGMQAEVTLRHVDRVTSSDLVGLTWLIVGSPTQGFRPTKAITALLENLPALDGVKVATFDTRLALETIHSPILRFIVNRGGYAAKPIAEQLRRNGGELIVPPEGFLVDGKEGPLKTGEVARAAVWAEQLVTSHVVPI